MRSAAGFSVELPAPPTPLMTGPAWCPSGEIGGRWILATRGGGIGGGTDRFWKAGRVRGHVMAWDKYGSSKLQFALKNKHGKK